MLKVIYYVLVPNRLIQGVEVDKVGTTGGKGVNVGSTGCQGG